jgi:MarR family transcriptional regulator, organic hydroperoxide resistance regulator
LQLSTDPDQSEDHLRSRTEREPVPDANGRLHLSWREDVPNDQLAHLVKDTARAFSRSLQGRLAEQGVAVGHWTFLRILWQRDRLTQRELSIEAGVMEPTTLTALRAMESLGYVVREQLPGNRKNVYVRLTPLGRRLKRKLVPQAESVNQVAAAGLAEKDLATLRFCLEAMIANLMRDDAARETRR